MIPERSWLVMAQGYLYPRRAAEGYRQTIDNIPQELYDLVRTGRM